MSANELQDLLHECFKNQQERIQYRRAQIFAWSFAAIFGCGAAFMYLAKWNHWFGVR